MAKPRILQQLDGELSTDIVLNNDPDQSMEAVTKQYVDAIEDDAIEYMNNNLLSKNNDSGSNITLTNANITLTADPTTNMQAATKQYVDKSGIPIVNITSTNQINYIGTSEAITEYKEGMIISFIPDVGNIATSSPLTININGLGDLQLAQYTLKKPFQSNGMGAWQSTGDPCNANFIYSNEVFTGHLHYNESTSKWFFLPFHPSIKLTEITNGTLGYNLSVTANSSYLNNSILRNIAVSTLAPTSSDGNVGDIWIQYST